MPPRVKAETSKSIFKDVQKQFELQEQQTAAMQPEAAAELEL